MSESTGDIKGGQKEDESTAEPPQTPLAEFSGSEMCRYCANMDVDQMVCEPSDTLDPSSNIPSAWCYQVEGYRHQPSYQALVRSANAGCRVCEAFAIEITRFLNEDVVSHWHDRLHTMGIDDSQIYLHYPTSEELPSQGLHISVAAPFERLRRNRRSKEREKGCGEVDTDESSEDDIPLPKAVVIGKIGLYFLSQTDEEKLVSRKKRQEDKKLALENGANPIDWQLKQVPEGYAIEVNPASITALNSMRHMIQNCVATHDCCRIEDSYKQMPTRLIDIGPDSTKSPRLIHTIKDQTYSYAALSHSWGGKVCYTTTTSTLRSREIEIRMDELPLNFSQAIELASGLGIRYVWIDSICIVQDDKEDWAKEAAIMGAIYVNSLVTISATTARDSTTGFLHRRSRRFKPIVVHHSSVNPYLNRRMVIRPWLRSWTQSVEGGGSPLSSRGWVLQERLLPPRTLHFGSEQTFWECRRELVPEGHVYEEIGLNDKELYFRLGSEWEFNKQFLWPREDFDYQQYLKERRSYRSAKDTSALQRRSVESLHKTWSYIVQNYSTRKLTFQSDKFVAISGIAQRMHALLGDDTYIAGLWKKNLLHGLLWTAARKGKRNPEYVAPSWSWASMITPVSYPNDLDGAGDTSDFRAVKEDLPAAKPGLPDAELHGCEVVLVSNDPFGQVSSGVVKLMGRWCQVRIEGSDGPLLYASSDVDDAIFSAWARTILPGVDISTGEFTMAFSDDGRATCEVTEDGNLEFSIQEGMSPHNNNLFTADAIKFSLDEPPSPETFCRDGKWQTFELQHITRSYYLMLRKDTESHEQYRRIGVASMIELPGNKTSIEPGASRSERIVEII